jgi:hypothetical protein
MKKIFFIIFPLSLSLIASQLDFWQTVPCQQLEKQLQAEWEKPYDTSRDFPILTFVQCPKLLEKVLANIIDKDNPIHQGILKRALRHAIMIDNVESARLLLQFGVSASSRSGDPMNYVRSEQMVDLLVQFGGKVNRSEGYSTPLYWALDGRFSEAVKGLLKNGADQVISRKNKVVLLSEWISEQRSLAQNDSEYLLFLNQIEAYVV